MNPLLDTVSLPRFTEFAPELIAPALDALIARQDAAVDGLVAARPTDFAAAWLPLERIDTDLDALWSTVSHLHGVADTPALRAAHAEGQQRLVETSMRMGQNRELFEVLTALRDSSGFADLSGVDQAAVIRAIRGFEQLGVGLDAAARERFGAVQVELSALANAFSSAVLDATEAWSEHVTDPALLAGLSDADKDMFAAAARAKGLEGWLVTLQQPSVSAILSFCENRDLCARVYRAYGTRASDQGPNAGAYDNGPRIARILELRRESAALLGYADPVALSLSTKMAEDADEILAFLRDLARRARPFAEAELAEVRAYAAEHLGIADLQPWDMGFASNRLRQARYAIDEQAVRAYFPVERVVAGWKTLLTDLFGITLVERTDVALWHADAHFYDLRDADGSVFAGLYVDLHARTGKRGGAWMAQARSRIADGERSGVPVAYLTCNFAPAGETTPSLLSHNDVGTLLHETGHCLHHLFGLIERPIIGGITGFEWDAVELPSQLMEDFAWDPKVLTGMSGHYRTGEPLPADLFERMLGARRFQAGLGLLRQVEFAMFDLLLHLGTLGDDPIAVHDAVRNEVAVTRPPEWHRFAHGFSHIFAGGYAAGYYSYLWAELLAADAFGAFVAAGLVDRKTGDRLRAEILSRGASRPAIDSFRAFMGRDPDPAAMLVRHGLQ
ncbi:M3 family metallopeptidase [Sphingomonas sp. CROZ-RG-20F-R02-07]|uniref:M3 family metallopeptidase n=1 Tax=Sphingomonas sp. CROZ-RG-20F-R02-07 TaxID=2914832 RepID=UPI001F59E128|nr:M3 family metallopeptidase [Sphingomonas sp. CROZ-RG-20F-R02-07]